MDYIERIRLREELDHAGKVLVEVRRAKSRPTDALHGAKWPSRIETIYEPPKEKSGAGVIATIGLLALLAVKLLMNRGVM